MTSNPQPVYRTTSQSLTLVEQEQIRPSVLFRPTLGLDGNKYVALYGPDYHSGCAGFGDTPDEAMRDFDRRWTTAKAPPMAGPQVQRKP